MTDFSRRALLCLAATVPAVALWPAPARAATTHKIDIKNYKFIPATLEVKPGDRIQWNNRDRAPHDATAADKSWKTKTMRPNRKAEITVTADMTTDYFCSIHPRMKAKLIIRTA